MEADNPIVSDFRAQVQKIIQANLKDNLSSMSDEELASFLIDLYMMRTKNHIALVNTVASHMFPAFEKVGLGREDYEVFLHEVEHHDNDKLTNDPETIAIQVLGSINKYSKASGLYRPSQYAVFKYLDVMDNHVKKNQHHPEFWASVITNDNKLILNMDATSLFGKAEPYLTSLSTGFRILAEMVCDWTAVGIELKSTSAKEWFEQWYGKRWVADATIMKLMNTLCEVAEEATKDKEFVMPYDYSNLKWPTKIPDEINDRSCEDMFILTKTLKHQKLNALAKPLYNPIGQNSWEHIQQDVANGVYLVQQVQNREITLQEYATILFHDCSVKSHPDKVKHSLVSADIAKPILEKTGFFTPEEIDEIYQAIVEHDYEMNPEMKFSTDLSDFLASADFNPPNYAWILNKSYSWGISHGLDHEGRIQNVFTHIPKTYGSKGTITYPKLYTACYQDKIKEMQKFFDNMTKESCEKTIMEYRKRCGLSDTDTQLPDPSKEAIEEMFLSKTIGVEECSAGCEVFDDDFDDSLEIIVSTEGSTWFGRQWLFHISNTDVKTLHLEPRHEQEGGEDHICFSTSITKCLFSSTQSKAGKVYVYGLDLSDWSSKERSMYIRRPSRAHSDFYYTNEMWVLKPVDIPQLFVIDPKGGDSEVHDRNQEVWNTSSGHKDKEGKDIIRRLNPDSVRVNPSGRGYYDAVSGNRAYATVRPAYKKWRIVKITASPSVLGVALYAKLKLMMMNAKWDNEDRRKEMIESKESMSDVSSFIDNNANFYRVVYEGVGIYQAMKEHSSKQQWEEFLSTDAARWLPKPDCDYRPTYESYFTSLGYKTFMEKTESYLKKVLDPNKIRVQNYGNIDLSACVYQDPFQIVIDTRKLKDKPMIVDLFVDFE